ncbi:DUF6388 family protein [Pseudomonas sp. MWU13-3659]|uniref:DUF6388 family protein n=1 Tax=Pseudomonas sp. MWU13-3659 TaxID=2986964 RepID=UPI002074E540|nr:DUF6388 family protein [Pseudomonas sp. MWU13-3659]
MPSYEQRYDAARDKFFADNPHALAQVELVNPRVIEACGVTVEEFQKIKRIEIFAQAAQQRGLDLDEFVIHLVADSPQQAQEWRLKRHHEFAEALGMDWEEYKKVNRIVE